MTKKRKVTRDAITGKFVSREEAKNRPDTTVTETYPAAGKKQEQPRPVGEREQ